MDPTNIRFTSPRNDSPTPADDIKFQSNAYGPDTIYVKQTKVGGQTEWKIAVKSDSKLTTFKQACREIFSGMTGKPVKYVSLTTVLAQYYQGGGESIVDKDFRELAVGSFTKFIGGLGDKQSAFIDKLSSKRLLEVYQESDSQYEFVQALPGKVVLMLYRGDLGYEVTKENLGTEDRLYNKMTPDVRNAARKTAILEQLSGQQKKELYAALREESSETRLSFINGLKPGEQLSFLESLAESDKKTFLNELSQAQQIALFEFIKPAGAFSTFKAIEVYKHLPTETQDTLFAKELGKLAESKKTRDEQRDIAKTANRLHLDELLKPADDRDLSVAAAVTKANSDSRIATLAYDMQLRLVTFMVADDGQRNNQLLEKTQ